MKDSVFNVLYHRTSAEFIKNILKEGLKCSMSFFWKGRGGCIYLSTMADTSFGEALLQINGTGLSLTGLSDWERVCWEDISPGRIKVIQEVRG